ncbi:MAG: hypothetical protein WBK55_09405 [Alphaproteobacteria bacterium]
MTMSTSESPLAKLSRRFNFGKGRLPYSADLSNVVENIAARVERERCLANDFEPMIFPVTTKLVRIGKKRLKG